MNALISAWLPRILGVAATWATTRIAEKTGIIVDSGSLVIAGVAAYSAVHRAVSTKMNPGDAAKPRMVEADKNAVDTGSAVVPAPPVR